MHMMGTYSHEKYSWRYTGFWLKTVRTGITTVLLSVGLLLTSWFAWLYRRRLQRRHAYQLALHKQELAEQASAAKTRFLANLGHEIRTPMTGVLGMLPTASFALFGVATPALARRLGLERTTLLAMVMAMAGLLLRSSAGNVGTLLLGWLGAWLVTGHFLRQTRPTDT